LGQNATQWYGASKAAQGEMGSIFTLVVSVKTARSPFVCIPNWRVAHTSGFHCVGMSRGFLIGRAFCGIEDKMN
jgi:hypothetical protein